jgi:hypothetical protein
MGEHCAFLSPQVGPEREHTHALLPSLMACSSCCRKLTEHAKVYLYLPRQRDSRGAGCYRTNTPCLSTLDEKVCVCARARVRIRVLIPLDFDRSFLPSARSKAVRASRQPIGLARTYCAQDFGRIIYPRVCSTTLGATEASHILPCFNERSLLERMRRAQRAGVCVSGSGSGRCRGGPGCLCCTSATVPCRIEWFTHVYLLFPNGLRSSEL